MATTHMTADQLARSMAVNANQFAWFLGAGASAAANIPTGYDMILDFKARLFCSAVKVPRREIDPSDPLWLQRITAHFDNAHGLPANGHPDEYAAAFEAVFSSESERRSYIERCVHQGAPSFGHRLLAAMIASRQTPCLFTTNFDQLIERSAIVASDLLPVDQQAHLTVAALDSVERAERCMQESAWPLLVKLHGDYQSTRLKNTTAELQSQDAQLRKVLVDACNRFGLIVVGYSGRDASVMEALHESLDGPSPFAPGLRWVLRSGQQPLEAVGSFLETAKSAGVDAQFVESETFDELAADIDRQLTLSDVLVSHVLEARPLPLVQPVALSRVETAPFPVLRCSALPVLDMPDQARRIRLSQPTTTTEARKALKDARVWGVAAARGREIVAFGADEDLQKAFDPLGATLDGIVPLDPTSDSLAVGMLYDALARALRRGRPLRSILRRRGHSLVLRGPNPRHDAASQERDKQRLRPLQQAYSDALVGSVPGSGFPFAEGVRIRLEHHDDRWWCVFDPFTWVDLPRPERSEDEKAPPSPRRAADPTSDWRRERWARRYNQKWSAILDAWAGLLVSGQEDTMQAIGLRGRDGVDASFRLSSSTAWCRPGRPPAGD